ncbi:MAG: hypothetical protein CVV25_08210 [Ignavibacteriae bacterium HGW-Ignavibacteriae-4]|jgi:hypothetical protein|nr:MAG: hypothetical protein CVV25_08210 [Ignavibacteriae bacterium HGW-Ignavibacteriae-4]
MNKEKRNITYLFGAGASAETIPVVNEFPFAIERIITELNNFNYKDERNNAFDFKFQDILIVLIRELEKLKIETQNHMSIDTYAKKLYVLNHDKSTQSNNEYKEFKRVFTCLLLLFTLFRRNISKADGNSREIVDYNKRYDAFIAGLINTSKELPAQVNIVSWNYDIEFEKALYQYYKDDPSLGLKNMQYIYNFSPSDKTNELNNDYLNEFKFCKLNGNILLDYNVFNRDLKPIDNIFTDIIDQTLTYDKRLESLKNILHYYFDQKCNSELENLITFSWEKTPLIDETHRIARTIFSKSDEIVVVGYSFPFFNRIVDSLLFGSLTSENRIRRIYIQDIRDNTLQIKESVSLIVNKGMENLIKPLVNLDESSPIYIPQLL